MLLAAAHFHTSSRLGMRLRHRVGEYNSLVNINKQSETHLAKQTAQISELRDTIANLIQDNQSLKIRERDANKEAAEAMRLRLQLNELEHLSSLQPNP